MIPVPTFCRVEYWNAGAAEWRVGHAGINLMDPGKYVRKLAERETIARVVEIDTDTTHYADGGDLL